MKRFEAEGVEGLRYRPSRRLGATTALARRQKAEQLMFALNRRALRASHTTPGRRPSGWNAWLTLSIAPIAPVAAKNG